MRSGGYDDLALGGDDFCPCKAFAFAVIAEEQRCPLSDGLGTLP
jgi:hypothetical protein